VSKLKAAVVGLGIGHAHCAAYLDSEHAELAAVCDVWPGRLESVGGTFSQGSMRELRGLYPAGLEDKRWRDIGVRTYSRLNDLLADPEIRLVSVCTPDHLHAEQACRVLEAGKHLLLEKPLALDMAGAEAIGRAVEKSGKTFSVDYEFRLNPAVMKLRELVSGGFTGPVEALSVHHFRTPFKRDKYRHWIQKQVFSGGLIVEETSHWLDLARYISGLEVDSVSCRTAAGIHADFDYEDIAYLQGEFAGGGIWQISHALSGFAFSLNICVHGRRGTAWCALKENPRSLLDGKQTSYCGIVSWGEAGAPAEQVQTLTYGEEATEPYTIRAYARHFAACAAGEEEPRVSFNDARLALELSLAARRAAAAGATVDNVAAGDTARKEPR
jgi:UDP-N-acetyl-2-amino-2-deoxyglucuronate dehydrogenase